MQGTPGFVIWLQIPQIWCHDEGDAKIMIFSILSEIERINAPPAMPPILKILEPNNKPRRSQHVITHEIAILNSKTAAGTSYEVP